MRPTLNLLEATDIFVFEQLLREEALFRSTKENWCILVQGSAPAIVMSHLTPSDTLLIDEAKWQRYPLPLVKRYTGGGTVVVDENTLFVCWILNSEEIGIDPYPQTIIGWVHEKYAQAMRPLQLHLKESDYCLSIEGEWRKVIGNAQAISHKRFVHHSSFLWDYRQEHMELLTNPARQPAYRDRREHGSFIYPLAKTALTQPLFQSQLIEHLAESFDLHRRVYSQLDTYLFNEYRRSCSLTLAPALISQKSPYNALNI